MIQLEKYNYTHKFFHEITDLECRNSFRIVCDVDKEKWKDMLIVFEQKRVFKIT